MTRIVTTAAAILLLTLIVGCQTDTGLSERLPQRTNPYMTEPNSLPLATPGSENEIDLVEKMVSHRQAYRSGLQALVQHYDAMGNNQKAKWAQQELAALDRIPQYRYISDVMPATLKASERITAADQLYEEAENVRRKAGAIPLPAKLKDEEMLRAALVKYSELISKYPTSDKIDDAAYRMAGIQEDLGDPTLAVQYYQRAYQWNPATPYPARYKAASVLDRKLRRRAEALELYQESIVKEAQFAGEKAAAERRIKELTTSQP